MMRWTQFMAILGVATLTGCGSAAAHNRIVPQPMATPTEHELGYEQGYPPTGQCRVQSLARYHACVAPLDGLRVRMAGGPEAGLFATIPAFTTETASRVVRVKAAVGNPTINDGVRQQVFGEFLVRGHAVVGAQMRSTWWYRGGTRHCMSVTDPYGVATCSEPPLGFASRDGDVVVITVSFAVGHRLYSSRVTYRAFSD